jgi:hypothetical protein
MLMASMNDVVSEVLAGEHPDRDRRAVRVGEQPVLDLFEASFGVPRVSEGGQLAAASLHPGAGHVKHGDPTGGQVPVSQCLFDDFLALGEPVHGGIDLIGARLRDTEVGAECRVVPPVKGRQCRCRPQHPGEDQSIG